MSLTDHMNRYAPSKTSSVKQLSLTRGRTRSCLRAVKCPEFYPGEKEGTHLSVTLFSELESNLPNISVQSEVKFKSRELNVSGKLALDLSVSRPADTHLIHHIHPMKRIQFLQKLTSKKPQSKFTRKEEGDSVTRNQTDSRHCLSGISTEALMTSVPSCVLRLSDANCRTKPRTPVNRLAESPKVTPHPGDKDIPLITNHVGLLESQLSQTECGELLQKMTLGSESCTLLFDLPKSDQILGQSSKKINQSRNSSRTGTRPRLSVSRRIRLSKIPQFEPETLVEIL